MCLLGMTLKCAAESKPTSPEIVNTTLGISMHVKAHKLSTLSALLANAFLVTACGGGGTTGGVIAKDSPNGGGAPSAWVNPGRVTLTASANNQAVGTVLVGVVDQGFDLTHAEINGQIQASKNFAEPLVTATTHGTNVAQVIAGKQVGYSGNVKLLLGSATDGTSSGVRGDYVNQAGVWAFTQGAKVVNYSVSNMWKLGYRDYMKPMYTAALNANGAIVVTAGNDNQAVSNLLQGSTVFDAGNEALRDLTLVVGAIGLDGTKAAYSNTAGTRADVQPDCRPGRNV